MNKWGLSPDWCLTMETKKVNYQIFYEKVKECIQVTNIDQVELHIIPLSNGYKLEVYPAQADEVLARLSDCISKSTSLKTEIKVYLYGKAIIVKM